MSSVRGLSIDHYYIHSRSYLQLIPPYFTYVPTYVFLTIPLYKFDLLENTCYYYYYYYPETHDTEFHPILDFVSFYLRVYTLILILKRWFLDAIFKWMWTYIRSSG